MYPTFIAVLHFYYQSGKPVVDYLMKVRFAIVYFRRIINNEKFKKKHKKKLLLLLSKALKIYAVVFTKQPL